MGIFDRFHKTSEAAGDTRRNKLIAALITRLEGSDKKNSLRAGTDLGQIVREDAEQVGDSILEVYLTSVGSAGTWSSEERITKFVKKYNDLLAQHGN
jgi:hypothetical protein